MTELANDREVRSSLSRIERDVDRFGAKLDAFLSQHAAKHDVEQTAFHQHLLAANESMSRSLRTEEDAQRIDQRLEAVEDWRRELMGAMGLVKFALGTSVLSAITAIVALVRLAMG